MIKKFSTFLLGVAILSISARGQSSEAPRENRYDVIGKMLAPFVNILLTDTKNPNRAVTMTIAFEQVSGRLSKQFVGATLSAAVQYPDKVKLEAPILGEQATVCRNGDNVWAIPGEKIQFLLKQFKINIEPGKKMGATPLAVPVTAQQAVFLPALFVIKDEGTEDVNGEPCRVLQGALMPDLGKLIKAEDFSATLWIAAGYLPRKVEIKRKDFTAVVAITNLEFAPTLPAETWQPPADAKDIYRCSSGQLESILYVVMNSLKTKQTDTPWVDAK